MMRYKSIADVTKDKRLYERALKIADLATARFGTKSYLPALNASTIYMSLGDYEHAEKNIKQAIEMAPGDAQLYLRLIELYKDFMKKDETTIIATYETGIQRLVNVLPLYNSYAAYLREINRLDEALDKYQILHKAMPDNPIYAQLIKELEVAIKNR
jgi:tetratricopeptide (TPR) repeat protein